MYADCYVPIFKSEDKLQTSAHQLKTSAKKRKLKLSISKLQQMDCMAPNSERGKNIEQVTELNSCTQRTEHKHLKRLGLQTANIKKMNCVIKKKFRLRLN